MKLITLFEGYILQLMAGLLLISCTSPSAESKRTEKQGSKNDFEVIAYYTGEPARLEEETLEQLTQIIYSFLHLQGNALALDNARDSVALEYLSLLKEDHPNLKVLISLGGWGGCESCSEVFATQQGRSEFARSVKEILLSYKLDGIDLDWEYPAIAGYAGHRYVPEDREHFSLLVQELRATLGDDYELSFAAGGFDSFLENSVEWDKVMPLLDRVNLMSYDLVSGGSPFTGHHTPLYSTAEQIRSANHAIQFLDSLNIPKEKIVIGAAFYARVWEGVEERGNRGLYQPGTFQQAITYNRLDDYFRENPGFDYHWDSVAQAPYSYNPEQKLFATYDDSLSIALKTQYVIENELGGIMFWQLSGDNTHEGLLEVIDRVKSGETISTAEEDML